MTIGIYTIKNVVNNKFYLGSSIDLDKRWARHKSDLDNKRHHSVKLQRAYNKYGNDNFIVEILEETNEELLREKEQFYLDTLQPYKTGYNVGMTACGGDNLTNNPTKQEIIDKIRTGIKYRFANESPEDKIKRCENITGSKNPNFGKRWSQKQRDVMSDRRKGQKASEETKTKISKNSKELWASQEYRDKMSESRTGTGNSFFDKRHSIETKQKISQVKKKQYETMSLEEKQKLIPHMKPVMIDNVKYDSASTAAKNVGVCSTTVLNRIRSPKFPNYQFA
jgi:group I intron endonuclease